VPKRPPQPDLGISVAQIDATYGFDGRAAMDQRHDREQELLN
jgi:hypothetical protein